MSKKIFLLFYIFPLIGLAQTQSENYIKKITYKQPNATSVASPTVDLATTSITYIDGLGRQKQHIAVQQTPSGKNIVLPVEYDAFGRPAKTYLPYKSANNNLNIETSNVLGFYANPTQATTGNPFFEGTNNPFLQSEYEASPLNRITEMAAPGNDWAMANDHTAKIEFKLNTTGDQVRLYKAYAVWNLSSELYETSFINGIRGEFYIENQLKKTVRYDSNSGSNPTETAGSTIEFKNSLGQTVLKRIYDSGTKYDTYYVYDQFGNLSFVVPPKAENAIDQTVLDNLCFQYKYDARNRLVEKKMPGKQWEFFVYDKSNRLVMSGPTFAPFKENTNIGWNIVKYDALKRPVYTGWYDGHLCNTGTRKTLQVLQNNASVINESRSAVTTIDNISIAYTNNVFPTTAFYLLEIKYYDNYYFPNVSSIPSAVEGQTVKNNPVGLPTGSWSRVLTSESEFNGNTVTVFYDSKTRIVRTAEKNYLGGYNQVDNKLNFLGITEKNTTIHKRTAADTELKLTNNFTYSSQGRLTKHTHQINNLPEQLLAENTYDEMGQLIIKDIGNSSGAPLQKINYKYNIRGWLTEINDVSNLNKPGEPGDLFAFKINYNTVENLTNYTGTPLYNGNIAETYWRTSTDNVRRKYGFKYDKLSRFKEAIYQRPDDAVQVTSSYNESLTYDKNGNIVSLQRNGDFDSQTQTIPIDDLSYTYKDGGTSNRLAKVADNSGANSGFGFKDGVNVNDDFEYDDNGNLIEDRNKGITIKYNHLNLPVEITFATPVRQIKYVYTASGKKVQKTTTQGANVLTTDYLGGFQYKKNATLAPALQFFPTAEGYVNFSEGVYKYVFNYIDHLGNIRLSYVSDANSPTGLAILEQNHYYPFGLKHTNYNTTILKLRGNQVEPAQSAIYKYKNNGKEWQDEFGLNFYDYGGRNYDPTIGRWMNIDPSAENGKNQSPYDFAFNNPVIFVDPDGKWPIPWQAYFSVLSSMMSENQKNAANGIGNVVFGSVAILGIATGTVETGGLGAFALGAAFTASVAEVSLGLTQINDAFRNNSGNAAVQNSNSLFGYMANVNSNPNAKEWDAFGSFFPGMFSGGNIVGTSSAFLKLMRGEKPAKEALIFMDGIMDIDSAYDAIEDYNEEGDDDYSSEGRDLIDSVISVESIDIVPHDTDIDIVNDFPNYTFTVITDLSENQDGEFDIDIPPSMMD